MLRVKIIVLLLIFFISNTFASKVEIIAKVDEKIITNVDVVNEIKYLNFLNPKLLKIDDKNKINEIAKSSLIREIIKENELKKIIKNNNDENLLNDIENNFLARKGYKNKSQFIKNLKSNNLDYEFVVQKLKIEALWNQLIFQKFRNQVKINNEYLKKKIENFIKNKDRKFEFYLYEILFDVEKVNDLDKEYNKIISTINKENFNIAANEHSISNSSKFGGEIGWVKETQLSNDIFNIVKNLNTNEISKPFRTPGGYLILMFDKKKDLEELFDKKKELENLKKYERNRQLNQYSLIYYKRLKKNSTIYEY